MKRIIFGGLALMLAASCATAPKEEINDSNTPLHLLQADYKTPYGQITVEDVKKDIDRVFAYVDEVTPAKMTDGRINPGTFRLTSYEWAVMYDALLDAAVVTGDERYSEYVSDRIGFLAAEADKSSDNFGDWQLRQVKNPVTLDDAGAMAGAWMRAAMADPSLDIDKCIERYWNIIVTVPVQLADGTIARNRPHYNAVWLDDMFMALPSMAVRSHYKSEPEQLDKAADIAVGFFRRMWMPEKGIFRHGYIEGLSHQPSMAWGRANGWAILTICQLLDFLPENHPRRAEILDVYRGHVAGLAELQGVNGFWHQLLDRPETYEETSATAIFTYAIAHGINMGWIDAMRYGPVAQLGWRATASKINETGEVEGTCVGTGMGFDPAFYAYRPVSSKAAHGYGPVIWAGSEIIRLLNTYHQYVNDSAVHYYVNDPEPTMPIFSLDANGKATGILH